MKKFGLPVTGTFNKFIHDTKEENAVIDFCKDLGVKTSLCTHWADGVKEQKIWLKQS